MGRGLPDQEHLVFDVGVDGCDLHFVISINEGGQMVRRDLAMLLMLLMSVFLPSELESSPCRW